MAHETRNAIQSLLEDEKSISTRVGTRLTLTMLIEMDDKIEGFIESERAERKALEQRVKNIEQDNQILKKNDVFGWAQKNPRSFLAAFIASVILINIFQEYLLVVIKKWIGLP